MSKIYPVAVPKWGIEMVEGTVTSWNKAVGEAVSKGDEVFEMESDKIVNVWEAPADGTLRRILAEEGEARAVGELLGIIAADNVDDAAIDEFISSYGGAETSSADTASETAAAPAAAAAPAPTAAVSSVAPSADGGRRVNPVVRRLAEELGVDLDTVEGSGRNGRITKEDIVAAAEAGPATTESSADADAAVDYQVIPLSATRKTIARRLSEAKRDIPHFYLSVDLNLEPLLAHRKKLNANGDTEVSINDLLVWCVARALMEEPRINVNLVGDDIHQFNNAHVSVAVATDDGLYPVTVRNADNMTPQEIATATGELAEKAKAGSLAHADISGGSFTVSNLGMFGVDNFTAIINPPMAAILAVGRGQQRVVVKDGETVVVNMLSATLSCDHRAVDGAVGAQFLMKLQAQLAAL